MDKEFINKFDLKFNEIDYSNPISLGNGNLCITVNQTGLQNDYKKFKDIPLSCFSNYFWNGVDILDELKGKTYKKRIGEVNYMTYDDNEALYNDLRHNMHKYSLFNLSFDGDFNISKLNSRLDLYNGILNSSFLLNDKYFEVNLSVSQESNSINYLIKGEEINLILEIFKPSYKKEGVVYEYLDFNYDNYVIYSNNKKIYIKTNGEVTKDKVIKIKAKNELSLSIYLDYYSNTYLNSYFDKLKNLDTLNYELNRRMVLSLYLMKINTLGIYPPAETGLTCNSWYGKFHLEMHLWHHLGLIYFNAYDEVYKSMEYYLDIFEKGLKRAKSQGYDGCRMPKMTDITGKDSPSTIGCLLVWQAPHVILLLNELKNKGINIFKFNNLIYEVAKFIKSFFIKVEDCYLLDKPLIPSQECYNPLDVESPLFEVEYLRYGLILAKNLLNTFEFDDVIEKAIKPYIKNSIYQPDITDLDHYSKFAVDHPSVIGCYSFFKSDRINKQILSNTINQVLKTFDLNSMWGWDFSMLSMALYNVGRVDEAKDILLLDTPKNTYLKNGHNKQGNKPDLPLYLPGNGSLLLALAKIYNL